MIENGLENNSFDENILKIFWKLITWSTGNIILLYIFCVNIMWLNGDPVFLTGAMIDNQVCSHMWGVMVNSFMKHLLYTKEKLIELNFLIAKNF